MQTTMRYAHLARLAVDTHPAIATTAAEHAAGLLHDGFTIAQVVHNYGGICQTITEMAGESALSITIGEFRMLNSCLDDAIAGAVTEYSRVREYEGTERLGHLAHELRNLLNSAVLSYEMLKSGSVAIGGSTGAVLGRSLAGLQNLVDRELAEVRLGAGIHQRETVVVREFLEDVEAAATLEANARGLQFSVVSVSDDVTVHVDRQILASVVANLLQNAFKFTRARGRVSLHAYATSDRVLINVEDQCGGLPPGKLTEMFGPFRQHSRDRTGLGLGLSVCDRGACVNGGEIRVHNDPGSGCTFTVDLPRRRPCRSRNRSVNATSSGGGDGICCATYLWCSSQALRLRPTTSLGLLGEFVALNRAIYVGLSTARSTWPPESRTPARYFSTASHVRS